MNNAFNTIGLIGKYADPGVNAAILELGKILEQRGCEILVDESTARHLQGCDYPRISLQDIGQRCDLAITIGGDGTLLNAARSLVQYNVPLLGINLGRQIGRASCKERVYSDV